MRNVPIELHPLVLGIPEPWFKQGETTESLAALPGAREGKSQRNAMGNVDVGQEVLRGSECHGVWSNMHAGVKLSASLKINCFMHFQGTSSVYN